jgi:hypothetical protein
MTIEAESSGKSLRNAKDHSSSPHLQHNQIIEQQQVLIQKLQDQIALSSRALEEERQRLIEARHQDSRSAAMHQEQIKALQEDFQRLKPELPLEPDFNRDYTQQLDNIVAQQATSLSAMQEQIASLKDLMSDLQAKALEHSVAPNQVNTDQDSTDSSIKFRRIKYAPASIRKGMRRRRAMQEHYMFKDPDTESRLDHAAEDPGTSDPSEATNDDEVHDIDVPERLPSLYPLSKAHRLIMRDILMFLNYCGVAVKTLSPSRVEKLSTFTLGDILHLDEADLVDLGVISPRHRHLILKDLHSLNQFNYKQLLDAQAKEREILQEKHATTIREKNAAAADEEIKAPVNEEIQASIKEETPAAVEEENPAVVEEDPASTEAETSEHIAIRKHENWLLGRSKLGKPRA